jgi:cysteine desulfurase/selenocysteine lyase
MFYYEKIGVSLRNKDSTLSTDLGKKCDESRQKIAKFFNANTNEIIFTSGATESLNLIANGLAHLLTKNDEIALSYAEHSSALLP